MGPLIDQLYALPLLGVLFQLAGYLIEVLPLNAAIILQSAVPIALAALCGVMCERSGVVNIGLEGIMLVAAFVGWYSAALVATAMGPGTPLPLFGATPALLVGVGVAVLSGMLVSLLHAWLSISARIDQIIGGTIINIGAAGITGYLYTLVSG